MRPAVCTLSFLTLIAVATSYWAGRASAYEKTTHAILTDAAVRRSRMDETLTAILGFERGIFEPFEGTTVLKHATAGAVREDDWGRFFNHFHDPMRAWESAGLLYLGSQHSSSILWGQDAGQDWSWPKARQYFLEALSGETKLARDAGFARTFRVLGHLVHLQQDAASPAHTRGDSHVAYNYESLVEDVHFNEFTDFSSLLAQPIAPHPAWTSTSGIGAAPVAIARLLDMDLYGGGNPAATIAGPIGLSEYTNANFFSEDTTFKDNPPLGLFRIPFPARSSVSQATFDITLRNGEMVKRKYFTKTADGDTGYRLATVGFLYEYIQRYNLDPLRLLTKEGLDESVYRDYAARLVPRAVGYSTALLDYFFRGDVWASGSTLSTGIVTFGDEPLEGTVTLYYDDEDDVRHPVPGAEWPISLAPDEILDDLRFDPPTDPKPKVPEKYTLVFRGTLGTEANAVAGAVVFIESRIIVQVNKRSDGTPFQGVRVRTIDFETGEEIGAATTDADGKVSSMWRPGKTVISLQYEFPHAYWAGANRFVSALPDARVVRGDDLDAEGIVRISLPRIDAEVPSELSSCTGFPIYAFPPGRYHESFFLEPDRVVVKQGWNGVTPDGARVIRSDTGEVHMLCGTDMFCPFPRHFFPAEDLNRIGEVIGTIEWQAMTTQQVLMYLLTPEGLPDDTHPIDVCSEQTGHDPVPQRGVVTIVER